MGVLLMIVYTLFVKVVTLAHDVKEANLDKVTENYDKVTDDIKSLRTQIELLKKRTLAE
jgi:D-ribose pyranose/furanose isomerase RbsD